MDETMRRKMENIRDGAEAITRAVNDVLGEDKQSAADWWDRRNSVLAEVLKRGGTVSKTEWLDIGRKYKISPRGLGGFFAYDGSMTKIGMDKRAISEKGCREVKEWAKTNPEKAKKIGLDVSEI